MNHKDYISSKEIFEFKKELFSSPGSIDSFYTSYKKKKKKNKHRIINAPDQKLKKIQRSLADYLCEIYKDQINKATHITGFVPDRSIIDNATPHLGSEWVINIDIADFFPSVTSEYVDKVLEPIEEKFTLSKLLGSKKAKTKFYGLTKNEIKEIAMLGEGLPQGSPASPVIANIAAFKFLDDKIETFINSVNKNELKESGLRFTRYADDITISTTAKINREYIQQVTNDLVKLIETKTIFKIKKEKINIKHRSQRQNVTGIIVNNQEVGVSRKLRNKLRAILHNHKIKDQHLDSSTLGVLNFIKEVNNKQYNQLTKEFPCKLLTSIYSNQISPTNQL